MPIFDFNTIPAVMALGSAVSQCSRQILLQIGDTIRTAEREAIEERRIWDGVGNTLTYTRNGIT